MKKLNNLKDLNTECLGDEENEELWIDIKQLKYEAMKWVHKIRDTTPNDEISSDRKLCTWIMNFFNITEKDLK